MLNNSSNLYGSEWLALVFSNRNKNYGAYTLRMESSRILVKSLLIVGPLFVLLFLGPMIYARFKPQPAHVVPVVMDITNVTPIHDMKKELPKKEEPKKEITKPEPILEKVKSVNLSANIKVVDKDDIPEPPTTASLSTAIIASSTSEGKEGTGNDKPVNIVQSGGDGTGTSEDDNTIYTPSGVEKFPEFPGGMVAWGKFIQKNLRYPAMAQENGIQGKVYISFVIEKDGSVSDVSLMRGIGAGCDEEAIRVIKKSPKWLPGMQNKSAVRVRYNMPINYTITP